MHDSMCRKYGPDEIFVKTYFIFSSPEPKALDELIRRNSSRCPSVRPSVRLLTFSDLNSSDTSQAIKINFIWSIIWVSEKVQEVFGQIGRGFHGSIYLP